MVLPLLQVAIVLAAISEAQPAPAMVPVVPKLAFVRLTIAFCEDAIPLHLTLEPVPFVHAPHDAPCPFRELCVLHDSIPVEGVVLPVTCKKGCRMLCRLPCGEDDSAYLHKCCH